MTLPMPWGRRATFELLSMYMAVKTRPAIGVMARCAGSCKRGGVLSTVRVVNTEGKTLVPTVKVVLLDMGGVVLDMAGGHGFPNDRLDWRGREALLNLIRSHGGRADSELLDSVLFEPWHHEYKRRNETLQEADWRPHLANLSSEIGVKIAHGAMLEVWFRPYGEQLQPIDGVSGALDELSRLKIPVVLVSNVPMPGSFYSTVLSRLALQRHFRHLFFSYDQGSRKPSPAMLRHACEAVGVSPFDAVMVGDRRDRDIAAGQLAGSTTVWIKSSDSGGPDPDHAIDSLAELPDLLRHKLSA